MSTHLVSQSPHLVSRITVPKESPEQAVDHIPHKRVYTDASSLQILFRIPY